MAKPVKQIPDSGAGLANGRTTTDLYKAALMGLEVPDLAALMALKPALAAAIRLKGLQKDGLESQNNVQATPEIGRSFCQIWKQACIARRP